MANSSIIVIVKDDGMLKMVICCLGGFSSSIMCEHVKEEIKANGLEGKVSIEFLAFGLFKQRPQDYDIALLCPHLRYQAKRYVEEHEVKTPLYLIPAQIYGTMRLKDLLVDALDLLDIYKVKKENPVHFEDEEILVRDRNVAHRFWVSKQQKAKA